jgi:HK97 family phage portal protein
MKLFGHEITVRREQRDGSPLDNPAVPLNSPAIWDWLIGGEPTASGELINERTALQITTVYACVRVLAESVASLPFKLFELMGNGRRLAVEATLYYLLAYEPNPEMSSFTFFETLTGCLALTGNCYAQIERNANRQPVALWPLHPLKTEPFRQANNSIAFRTSDGMTSGATRIIQAQDVLHIPLFSFDGLRGISPIGLARQSLGLAKATEKFGARFFGNGSRPGGVLTNKGPRPDEKTQKELKESWNREHGGTNQGKTAFLFGGDWDYKQIGLSPEDSQFLATRQFQRAEIAGFFRVPPHMVGDTTRLSNSNHEQQSLQFVTDTLRPYLGRFEAEFLRKLLPRQGCKASKYVVAFDVSERCRGDFATTQAGFAAGRQWGWYTANDVLRKLGDNAGGPELDTYIVPVNMQNAARLLDTESIQDQPIAIEGKPVNTDPDAAIPTPAERSFLGPLAQAYIPLFRDAVGRFTARSKRDSESIAACFTPVLASISEEAKRQASVEFDLTDAWDAGAERIIRSALKSIEGRAVSWTPAEAGKISAIELTKAVRSILLNTYREAGAAKAMKGIAHA